MCGVFFVLVLVGILFAITPFVTSLVFVPLVVGVGYCFYDRRRRDEKIVSAEVISRTPITRGEHQYSGFSIGWHGNPRAYWRWERVPSHIQVELEVVYEDGKHSRLSLMEGSQRYNRIMSICEKRKKP